MKLVALYVTDLIRYVVCAELCDVSRGSLSKKFDVVDDDFFRSPFQELTRS